MYCSKCGAETIDNSRFCPSCGSPLRKDASSSLYGGYGSQFFEAEKVPERENIPSYFTETKEIPSYLIGNICATLICCVPFGIVGIVYSTNVNSAKARGDFEAARRASSSAKLWFFLSVVFGILVILGLGIIDSAKDSSNSSYSSGNSSYSSSSSSYDKPSAEQTPNVDNKEYRSIFNK